MTLPTRLTIFRLLLTFVIMALLFLPGLAAKAGALACFLLASGTDWLDGYLARRWRQTTPLGALLDPIADKVLVLGIFLVFVQLGLIPAWMVLIVLLRELLITGIRLVAASSGVVLAAAREGKHKMVSQVLTILVVLVTLLVREGGGDGTLEERWRRLILLCMGVTVVLTVVSGVSFFLRNWRILRGTASAMNRPAPRGR